jgi:hypothetical protein
VSNTAGRPRSTDIDIDVEELWIPKKEVSEKRTEMKNKTKEQRRKGNRDKTAGNEQIKVA